MKYTVGDEILEIDPSEMTYGEMQDAAKALDVEISSGNVMAIHGMNLWIARHRLNPELSPVQVTDWVRSLSFKVLATAQEDDGDPLPVRVGSPETTHENSGTPV